MKYTALCIGLMGLSFASLSASQIMVINSTNKTVVVDNSSYSKHVEIPAGEGDRLTLDTPTFILGFADTEQQLEIAMPDKWFKIGIFKSENGQYANIYELDELGKRGDLLGHMRLNSESKKALPHMERTKKSRQRSISTQ